MSNLYLVGTCHIDPKGPERLQKFLTYVRPDVITIEIDEERAASARQYHAYAALSLLQNESRYRSFLGDTLFDMFKNISLIYGYEVWASEEYVREHPEVRCSFVDKRDASKIIKDSAFGGIENFVKEIMPTSLSDCNTFQDWIDAIYKDPSRLIEILRMGNPSLFHEVIHNGEILMEGGIRAAYSTAEHACIHVGGVGHIIGDNYNLYNRLQDCHPHRVTLPELDKFS